MSSQELEEFRRQWREEVKSRKNQHSDSQQTEQKDKTPEDPQSLSHNMESLSLEDESDEAEAMDQAPKEESAMDLYIAAVDSEREGRLGEALASYRRAFRMDPDIDHAYKRHYQTHIAPIFKSTSSTAANASAVSGVAKKNKAEDDIFRHIVPIGNEYVAPPATRKDPLEDLILEFSKQSIEYRPFIDYKPVHVAKLPSEIMLHVLQHLVLHSVSTVANFSLVCKKFFLLTREPALWRFGCEHAFRSPYMSMKASRIYQEEYVYKIYEGHWMRMFIERPRIRYDGVYISTCHYIRPGSNENTYNQPVHLVTYYRYIRFFPDGTILKYLSTDEPSLVVRQLNRDFERRQVFRGHFEQLEGRIYVEMKDWLRPREDFRMTLEIKSTHRGRHNKLQWVEYSSYTDGRVEDESPYDLKMMKPYFFSGVRSYKVDLAHDPPENAIGPLTRRRAQDGDFYANMVLVVRLMRNQGWHKGEGCEASAEAEGDWNSVGGVISVGGENLERSFIYVKGIVDLVSKVVAEVEIKRILSVAGIDAVQTRNENVPITVTRMMITRLLRRRRQHNLFWTSFLMREWNEKEKRRKNEIRLDGANEKGVYIVIIRGCFMADILWRHPSYIQAHHLRLSFCWGKVQSSQPLSLFHIPVMTLPIDALYDHVQAAVCLVSVVLELEWTILSRFLIGVIVATWLSVIYLVWSLRHSRQPLEMWECLNKPIIKLIRPQLFSYLFRNISPYSATVDMRVSTLSRGFCTGIMRNRRMNRDPLSKCIDLSAIATFSRTVSLLALLSKDCNILTLSSFRIEVIKKADGLLTASSLEFTIEEKDHVAMQVVVKDRMLDTVAIAHLVWNMEGQDA
ncbi:hypothetical protein BX666DRAFT_1868275 [Dichotomocladium elegans]|nr:hypothetical protein BX666DRAFT_1868275 [Dichotomocladium elegans]